MSDRFLSPELFSVWQQKRLKGRSKYVWSNVVWGTIFLWQVVFLGSYWCLKINSSSPQWILWLRLCIVIAIPFLLYMWNSHFWNWAEKGYAATLALQQGKASKKEKPIEIQVRTVPLPKSWACESTNRRIFTIFLWLATGVLGFTYLPDLVDGSMRIIPLIFLILCVLLTRNAMEGGCRLSRESREFIRWYGIVLPIRKKRIGFASIRELRVARGKRPGSRNKTWSHVAVITDEGAVLACRFDYLPETQKFAEKLAREVGIETVTLTV